MNTLIQSQANFNHDGEICGSNIATWIDEESKEQKVAFTFFKGRYPNEYVKALELMSQGKLSVSFELLTEPDTKEYLADGTIRLHDIEYTGMGLLMDVDPAYENAQVETYANLVKQDKELMFASQILKTCDKILSKNLEANKKIEKGGTQKMNEEQKKLVVALRAELGDKIPEGTTDEQLLDQEFVSKLKNPVKEQAEETSVEKSKADVEEKESTEEASEKSEEKTEDKQVGDDSTEEAKLEITTEKNTVVKETIDDKEDKIEVDSETTTTFVRDGEQTSKEVMKETFEQTFTFAQVEVIKADAEKVGKLKVELKDNAYIAEFKDEDYLNDSKVEQAKLKQENDELKAKLEVKESSTEVKKEKPEEVKSSEKKEEKSEEVKASKTDLDTGFAGKTVEGGLRSVLKETFDKRTKK